MSIIGFPLLLIPIAICNIVIFLMPGVGFDAAVTRLPLPSGAAWTISVGDVLVALGILLLLFEVIKAARPGAKYVTDHLLSLLLLGGTIAEFAMLPQFGNATVFLLATLMLVDFLAGIALRNRPARARTGRDIPVAGPVQAEEQPAMTPTPSPEPTATTAQPAVAVSTPAAASSAAASIAEAVLLDRPQPVASAAAASSPPQVHSPGLQPAVEAAGPQPQR